jgi:hypothetical protein
LKQTATLSTSFVDGRPLAAAEPSQAAGQVQPRATWPDFRARKALAWEAIEHQALGPQAPGNSYSVVTPERYRFSLADVLMMVGRRQGGLMIVLEAVPSMVAPNLGSAID